LTGKCSHGGTADLTTGFGRSWDGINKDAVDSSHGSLHNKAADVGIAASVQLLEKIWKDNDDPNFFRYTCKITKLKVISLFLLLKSRDNKNESNCHELFSPVNTTTKVSPHCNWTCLMSGFVFLITCTFVNVFLSYNPWLQMSHFMSFYEILAFYCLQSERLYQIICNVFCV